MPLSSFSTFCWTVSMSSNSIMTLWWQCRVGQTGKRPVAGWRFPTLLLIFPQIDCDSVRTFGIPGLWLHASLSSKKEACHCLHGRHQSFPGLLPSQDGQLSMWDRSGRTWNCMPQRRDYNRSSLYPDPGEIELIYIKTNKLVLLLQCISYEQCTGAIRWWHTFCVLLL